MRNLKKHLERVSLEDAENSAANIKEPEPGSEPEEIKDLDADCLVDLDAAPKSEINELDECTDIKTSLEHFSELLSAAQKRGGMHPHEAVLMRTGLKHFAKRLGVADTEVPSMEDFGGDITRAKATTISQEAIVVIDKALIDKVIELVKKMLAKAKEFIAKLDLQTVKVDKILGDVQARYRKWKTGEVTFKSRMGAMLRSEDLTPEGLKAIGEAGQFSMNLLTHVLAATKTATKLNANVLLSSAGEEEDVKKFKQNVKEIWGEQHSPFVLALGQGRKEIKIGSATTGRLKVEFPNGTADQYSMEFITDYGGGSATGEAEVTMTKAEFSNLLNTCVTLNNAVKKNAANYKAIITAAVELTQMSAKAPSQDAARAISSVGDAINYIATVELENVVRKVASLRNGIGVFLLLAGSEFDKAGASVDVANNK